MDEVSRIDERRSPGFVSRCGTEPLLQHSGWNRLRRVVCSARRSSTMPRTPPTQPSFLDPPAVRAHEPRIRDAHLKLLWRSVILDGSSTLRADGVPFYIAARAASSFALPSSTIERTVPSKSNPGFKLVIRLHDGALVETVAIVHEAEGI